MFKPAKVKKWTTMLLVLALLASIPVMVSATTTPIKLYVNGVEITPDVPPIEREGRVMVPIRWIAEAFGAQVDWNEERQAVLINSTPDQAGPRGNSIQLIVNGQVIVPDVSPFLQDGRTLVPVRFVSEALGLDVTWAGDTRTVYVNARSQNGGTTQVIKVTNEHTIDRSKESVAEKYANAYRISVLDILDAIEMDSGIVREGTTFTNTLTVSGELGNRTIRIGMKNGQGLFDFTALNGSAGEVGVHLNVGVDVSKTTNGLYLSLRNEGSAESGYVSVQHLIDWRNYTSETAVFETIVPLYTTMWNVDKAYIEIKLPYQAKIDIKDIFLYLETEVYGFGDLHERITGGEGAARENIHLVRNAAEFLQALDKVRAAGGAPSIIYVDGTITYDDLKAASGKTDRQFSIGSDIRNLSVIGVADRALLDGVGFKVHGQNIILENMTIQYVSARDGVEINNAKDIWVRHNTFIDGGRNLPEGQRFDEFMSAKNETQGVIISWNKFYNGNRVLLVGSNDDVDAMPDRKIIFHHNYVETVTQRVPLYRGGHAHIYNNYFKDVSSYAVGARFNSKLKVENNYFENVRNPITDNNGMGMFEIHGNIYVNTTGSQPTESQLTINFKDYHYELDPTEQVPEIVMNGAGAGKIQQDLSILNDL